MDDRFESPQDAALAEWSGTPKAAAQVAHVTVRGRRAEVVVDVVPAYREWVYCVQGSDGWRVVVSGNGPTPKWADPDAYHWHA